MKVRPASDYNRSVSNILVMRGKDLTSVDVTSLQEKAMYPKWVPATRTLGVYTNSRPFAGYEKSASMLSNSQLSISTIDKLIDKAWSMFSSGAYVHQYTRHGITRDDFLHCFAVMEKVLHDYKSLSIS